MGSKQEGAKKAHPAAMTDDEVAELTVGACRELVGRLDMLAERLDKLEGELPSGTTAVQEARKVARLEKETEAALRSRLELADRVGELEKELRGHRKRDGQLSAKVQRLEAAGLKLSVDAAQDAPTPELLQTLRANGVTRYQDGELVIELGRAAAPRPALVSEPPNAAVRYRIAAEALWGLLDDIDTADDMAKDDDALYRGQARAAAARRHDHARSLDGGDHLTWSWQRDDPATCWHDVRQLKPEEPVDNSSIPDDAPPGAPEPAESPSGFGVDHDALAAMLEERARAMGRAPE